MVKGHKCTLIEDNINLIIFGVLNFKDFHNIEEYNEPLYTHDIQVITNNTSYTLYKVMFPCDASGFTNVCINMKHLIGDGITQNILTILHYFK
jgi:hypothetical protein